LGKEIFERRMSMGKEVRSEEINKYPEESLYAFIERRKREIAQKLFRAKMDLEDTKSPRKRRDLQEEIDDLKIDLGWTLFDCKEHEKGLALVSSVSWKTHGEMKCNAMARALTEMEHYDEARGLLMRGLRMYPDSYPLWTAMGILYGILGDDLEALDCFETALRYAPEDNSGGLYNKALTLMEIGCYGDAVPILEGLFQRHPEDPKYLSDRGVCALGMGYPQDALQYYQEAMKIWQENPSVYAGICIHAGLCSAYLELGMKKEGMEIALEGLKKFPDEDPVLYQNVGAAFWEMGWRQETIEVLKKGIEKFPDDEELKKFLKDAEDDTEDPDGSVKPSVLGLMLLMAILQKRFRKR
jgi:tetratricopeptide (TPR) repeat protein